MRLLVLYEKHFNRYFSVPTDKDLHKVCVKILKERLVEGWYDPGPKPEQMATEFISTLPQGRFRTEVLKVQAEQTARLAEWVKDQEFKEKVFRTIKIPVKEISWKGLMPHKVRAYGLLESRNNAEYERVSLDKTEN